MAKKSDVYSSFTALTRIKHDDVVYEAGEVIDLPAAAIPQLQSVNAIADIVKEAAPVVEGDPV